MSRAILYIIYHRLGVLGAKSPCIPGYVGHNPHLAPEKARLKKISDRINSIAIQVNQTGNIYPEDMQEIRQGVEEISARLAEYQAKLERFAVTPQTFRAIVDKAHEDVKK